METILNSYQEIIDDEEVTVWQLDNNDGAKVITINKLFKDEVLDCEWLDCNEDFLLVMYSDWDSNELYAIVDTNGVIIRDAIRSIECCVESANLIIVEMSGFGMGDEAAEYHLAADDWKMGVINQYGEFIIDPKYLTIYFDEQENVFCAGNHSGDELRYTIEGEKIKA